MKLSEKIQEALREQQEINFSDPAVQKRLAAQWWYVPAEAQPAPSVPEGWQLVPIEPTQEMLDATSWPNCAGTDYKKMLAAAPRSEAKP